MHKQIQVATTSLPEIMSSNRIEKIGFLKLDCEGSEGNIFLSLHERHFARIKQIALEFHDNESMLKHEMLIEMLHLAGFKTQLFWRGDSDFGYIYAFKKQDDLIDGVDGDHCIMSRPVKVRSR